MRKDDLRRTDGEDMLCYSVCQRISCFCALNGVFGVMK